MIRSVSGLRHGSETVALQARVGVVALTIAKHSPIFVILCLPPAIWAAIDGVWPLATALAVPMAVALVLYGLFRRRDLPDSLSKIEALVAVALVFLLGTLFTVPAFLAIGMPPVDALFEAMSAITTTGHSVSQDPDSWPFAAHFLRGWLQWCGGLVMATAVLALLLPPGVPARRLGRAGIDQGDRIASTRNQARELLGVYLGLTAIMAAATMTVLPGWREGLVITLSGISTAGFSPRSDSLASYSALGKAVVMLGCILGAMSLLTFVLLLQGKWRDAWALGSARRVLGTVAVLSVLQASFILTTGQGPEQAFDGVLNVISAVTTTGFSAGEIPTIGPVAVLLMAAMVMGGDIGSTAGGLKLARVGLLGRLVLYAVRTARLPDNAVAPLRMNRKPVKPVTVNALVALLTIYITATGLLWMQCLAHGLPASAALFDVLSTLSTVGLSTGVVSHDLPVDLKLSLTFAMWLGRLEFIAVLVLITPKTWMKRS
ncbi:TrkH family potassium uptake protein [Citreimonas salinaria]|uniref:Trk system potassium uptake protein TrkH n=1 Tax=Citreimonas salinaria TaxID=321339 RepID=A0A1H3J717_9RHOB|nr:potassium transporter TrkG [Citreimonas salinaria]SDY35218.1 trk system potassium uptake protein TrkH [Citreimonas salinaria]